VISKVQANNQEQLTRDETFYRSMLLIRNFEEKVLSEFSKGHFLGTTHTYIGQEANAIGILTEIEDNDIVVSNHRSHGHFLAYGGDMRALFAELMGKPTGVCGGRGGSQHLHWNNFYSNGVLGGTAPIATGMALAESLANKGSITVLFLGDGAFGEGVVYESLNMASLWSVPLLLVVENNQIAQSTSIELNLAGGIAPRIEAFGIETEEIESSDVVKINNLAAELITSIRKKPRPQALVINTNRFGPHSKGDDTRPEDVLRELRTNRDPIRIHEPRLPRYVSQEIEREIVEYVDQAFKKALADPTPG
jgi:TPP-dependent pyruvate/acetoin dehydrogenase alpha subunit